jgi:solute carrier family 6 GABA transporter-like protein 6/8/11/12/13
VILKDVFPDHEMRNDNVDHFISPFSGKVLQMSEGIDNLGVIRWELAACLILAWILVYFSMWKSVKSSGKVLYFTATFPYILILAFLAHSLTLDGSDVGLKYFFKPQWELLGDSKASKQRNYMHIL